MSIPDKLRGFRCYDEGNYMIGIVDATLPDIAYMTESIKGAGILGEIDTPAVGNLQSMTTTINWRSLIDENVTYTAPKTYLFDFRGSVQFYDEGSGEFVSRSVVAVMKCIPKKFTLGKLDVATTMGTSCEYEVTYLKVSIGSKEYIEVDKFAYICKINGVDYAEQTRKDMGMF